MEKRLDDSDAYIVSLQEKIKALVTEKETLLQAKKVLEEDKEQCQVMSYYYRDWLGRMSLKWPTLHRAGHNSLTQ